MKLRIFRPAIHPSGKRGFDAIIKGCRACGDDIEYTDDINAECDVAVHASGPKGGSAMNSLTVARKALIERFGFNRLILESPAIRPGYDRVQAMGDSYWRLSLGGFLRDEAEYGVDMGNSPPDRWSRIAEEQGIVPQDFHLPIDGHVLVMLQKSSDASLRGKVMDEWASEMVAMIRMFVPWPIVLRPHPLEPYRPHNQDNARISSGHDKDWDNARAVVTYTSLSAIDSLLRGLPTWTMHFGNMAWMMSNKSLSRLRNPWFPKRDVFQRWLNDLAYTQWSVPEIAEGMPWKRLKQKLLEKVSYQPESDSTVDA